MSAMKIRFATVTVLALAVLSATAGEAGAALSSHDQSYRNPALAEHRLATIAILPAVSVTGDSDVERWVERAWPLFYEQAQTTWMPAGEVRALVARSTDGSDGRLDQVRAQVWRQGEPDVAMAGALARSLGVDAVMSIRVDRWEIADGGRGMVELTAVLTGADGARLWSISGTAGHGRPPGSRERNFDTDMSWIRRSELEPRDPENRLGLALCTLLGRWSVALPVAMLPEAEVTPMLASNGNN
jgi:hypothetical protein